jgi:hypothetical protein
VASRDYARDRIKDTASRRSAIPSVGDRKLRRKEKENPGAATRAGTKKIALFDIVNRKARRRDARSPDGAKRNPGFVPCGSTAPHSAALHAGYGVRTACSGNALGSGRARASPRLRDSPARQP